MDDPRVWARGKTYAEVLGVADQSINALYQVATMPTPQQPQAPRGAELADDEIIDGRRMKEILAGYGQQQQNTGGTDQMAQLALATAKRDHAEVFGKYGHEVMGNLAQLPKSMWSLDNIERVVKMVKADHVEELAEELARTRFANTAGLSVRTNGAAGYPGTTQSGPSLESEELPADYRERLKRAGVTERMAREFCAASGMKFEDWIKNSKNLTTVIGEG